MQTIKISALGVSGGLRRIQILWIAIRIERAPAESDRFSLDIEHWKDYTPAKSIVRTALVFLDDQSALFKLFLRRALLTEMRRKSFPTVRRKTKTESLDRFFGKAALLQVVTHRGSR